MQNYQILIHKNLQENLYQFNFSTFLFNEPSHLVSQNSDNYYTFFLQNTKKNYVEARWTIFIEENQATSPLRASFGSIECNPKIDLEALYFFIKEIEVFLVKKNIESIFIKNYPFCYAPESSQILTHIFHSFDYQILHTELNQHINLNIENFLTNFHTSERRRLKKCQKLGFIFQKNESPNLEDVYNFVKKARVRKGFPISLPFHIFSDLFVNYPDKYSVFEVLFKDKIIALTVTVEINQEILYNFYPADNAEFLAYSPQVLLYYGLMKYAQKEGYKILDLGISTNKSKANFGLLKFKQNLGGEISLKTVFYKKNKNDAHGENI